MCAVALLTAVVSGVVVYQLCSRQLHKVSVVDAIKLFNGFKMKIELEQRAGVQLKAMQAQSDSIGQVLQAIQKTAKGPTDEQRQLYNAYEISRSRLQQAYTQSNEEINQQVWKRLNPLIEEYGKQQGLHLMIGANGMGTVLYTDGYFDKTEELIRFVNAKYENNK